MELIDTLIDIIDVCESKIPTGIQKLSELEIDDPKFATVLSNVEKCLTLSQGYKNLLMRNQPKAEGEQKDGTNN